MTLEQYTAKVVTKARDLLDSDIFPCGSEIWLRLSDLAEIDNISAEAAELYGRGRTPRPGTTPTRTRRVVLKNTFVPLDKQSKRRSAPPCVPTAHCGRASSSARASCAKTDYRRKGRRVDALDT
ncbi:hypothetical protein NIA69_02590 [Gemmiger formicilis]|nr:hypothetical protein [Gemmiger formicilis]